MFGSEYSNIVYLAGEKTTIIIVFPICGADKSKPTTSSNMATTIDFPVI